MNTNGSGSAESGIRKVGADAAGPAKIAARYKTTRKPLRIARCYGPGGPQSMKLLFAALLCMPVTVSALSVAQNENARWQQHAKQVRIIRDSWGIAHIYGKSDADT